MLGSGDSTRAFKATSPSARSSGVDWTPGSRAIARRPAADVDWAVLYGPEWQAMNGVEPASVVFAAGSAVSVLPAVEGDAAGPNR